MADDQVNLVGQHLCEQLTPGAAIGGQRGTSAKRKGYWIRSCLRKNCVADRLAFGGGDDPPGGSRGERRAAVVLNAKAGPKPRAGVSVGSTATSQRGAALGANRFALTRMSQKGQ
jgi:hypothetical protein